MIDSKSGIVTTVAGTGAPGYSGDVEFDFQQYPHIGPAQTSEKLFSKLKGQSIPSSYNDLTFQIDSNNN